MHPMILSFIFSFIDLLSVFLFEYVADVAVIKWNCPVIFYFYFYFYSLLIKIIYNVYNKYPATCTFESVEMSV